MIDLIKTYFRLFKSAKIVKYLFVGGCAAIVDISIFFIFAKLLNLNYLLVSSVSFIIATLVNYLLSIKIVFISNVRFKTKTEVLLVYFISSLGLLMHLTILYIFIDQLLFEKMLSKFIATATVFVWNFSARNFFVFKKKEFAG